MKPKPAPPVKKPIPKPAEKPKKENFTALTKDWSELEKNVWICSGSFSQAHKKYKAHNQQGAATCIVTCAFANYFPMSKWTKEILDKILELGSNLHLRSKQETQNRFLDHLGPNDIYKYFYLNDIKISMKIGVDTLAERVTRDATILEKTENFLKSFFSKHSSGIFAHNQTYFAIWRLDKFFYIFDPTEHSLQADKWTGLPGYGFCYCLRYIHYKYLAHLIIKNCELKQLNRFFIYPCSIEKHIKVNTTPPETYQKPVPEPMEPQAFSKVKAISVPKTVPKPKEIAKTVSKVLPPQRPKLQSVTNFQEIVAGRMGILRASTHQCDPKFTKYLKGEQSLCNAIAALTMLRQYKSKQWIKNILDDVLKFGEKLHHEAKGLKSGTFLNKISLNDIDYSPKIENYGTVGRLTSNDDKILNLDQALRNFLTDNDCCILIGPVILAIWREDQRFYLFDPNERDTIGQVNTNGNGVACLVWFSKLTDLVPFLLNNIPKELRKSRFMLNQITIKDYVAIAENWNNFKPITVNKWIIRGHFSQQDRRFPPESRNAQCTANATMALTFKELKEEKDWTSDTVDQVLINGDEFYRNCVDILKEAGRFQDKYLMVDELKRSFDVENRRINLEIDDCLVNGVINAKSDTGIPNLRKGFEEFFLESDAGVVTANSQSMAIWKRNGTYYYYDSHSRNEKGVACGYGTACILRMCTIEDLSKALMINFGSNLQNFFNISRVVVRLLDVDEGVVKVPLKAFSPINNLVAILRSSISSKDKKFYINCGRQTVPMCLVALAFNSITPTDDWSSEDLDQILSFGDNLYTKSMEANFLDETPEDCNVDEISTKNVLKQVTIGTNSIHLEFEDLASGNFEENLGPAFEIFDTSPSPVIFESPYLTVSIWRDDNSIYVFDPNPRDEQGQIFGKDDWSVKVAEVPEEIEEKTDQEEVTDDEFDEMGGGDNLGTPEEEVVDDTTYEENVEEDQDEQQNEEEDIVVEKNGSEFWRVKEEDGKACVLRFSRFEDVVKHVLENSPPNKRQETEFVLKNVRISNTPIVHKVYQPEVEEIKEDEIVGDWNEFKEVDYGQWILRSERNFRDGLFPVCNRGKQALPMCIVSLVFTNLYNLDKFNQETLNNILMYGDRLYSLMRKLRIKELKDNKDLGLNDEEIEQIIKGTEFSLKDYPKKICIGDIMTSWEFQLEAIIGDTTSKEPEVVHNLTSGVEKFLKDNKLGILFCRNHFVGLWHHENIFYMFDPTASGPSGTKSPIGVACITRYKNLNELTNKFSKNLPSFGNNFFEITGFKFETKSCVRERHPEEKPKKVCEVGGFKVVTLGKAILRGDLKFDCTKFDRGVHIHSASIAFVALALSLSKDPETWTRLIVNEILILGEELYNATLEKLGDKFNPWSDHLTICQVNSDFYVGKLKVNSAIRFSEQKGIVDVKNSKTQNLRQGLEHFFEENTHGILVADKFILAVWEQGQGDKVEVFVFDPNSRGATGLPGQGGVACVMKFCNAKLASEHIMTSMMDIDKTKTEFAVVPVEIIVGTAKSRRKVCPKTLKPPTSVKPASRTFGASTLKPVTTRTTAASTIKLVTTVKPVTTMKPVTTVKTVTGVKLATSVKPLTTRTIGASTIKPVSGRTFAASTGIASKKPVVSKCAAKAEELEQKKTLRKIAEEERARADSKRCAQLGRTEIYEINSSQAIIRGLRYIVKDRELPVNLVAYVFMRIATDLNKWSAKQLELILEAGYQLYVDSFNVYKPSSSKLTIQHVLRRVLLKDFEVKIDIRKPLLGSSFTKSNVLSHLTNFFNETNFCILNYDENLVSIFFKSGYYYYFDPYSRDLNGNKAENGAAMLMRFDVLGDLVEKVCKNLQRPEGKGVGRYALIVVGIISVDPLTK